MGKLTNFHKLLEMGGPFLDMSYSQGLCINSLALLLYILSVLGYSYSRTHCCVSLETTDLRFYMLPELLVAN